jgi:uncharacterized membrane protein YagU involved in acid resistance
VLDGLYASGLSASRGGTPVRVFQSVASGLLGRDAARAGGYGTALLGLLLHFVIASVVFTVFLLASRKLGVLTRMFWLAGPIYGLMVYFVMYDVVIPLSQIGPRAAPRTWDALLHGFAAHIFCVGLPAAFVARRAAG